MSEYTLTVGLEIHAELSTRSKMFCDSKNDPDEKSPNVNICPVCLGYPGTLPTINMEAVRSVLRLGVAVQGEIADYTEFDRKNYFYPDIPKGYQISQYKYPLVRGGELAGVTITRVHLEEDTAKSTHGSSEDGSESDLDFNRAGVPLLELVTEPVIQSASKAAEFARELQLTLLYLGISNANLEKGEMRIEANISVSKTDMLGTKVEVKNLNSFKAVEKAIAYEMKRHVDLLERGEKVQQETRGWDENMGETFTQRAKEESHDYRYFPDPDLPKLFIGEVEEFGLGQLEVSLPELPPARRERYRTQFSIKESDIETYLWDKEWGVYFEEVAQALADKELIQTASNFINTDLNSLIPVESLVLVVKMFSAGEISSRGAKDILKIIEVNGGNPREIAEKNNYIQKNNREEMISVANKVIEDNESAVVEYKSGKHSSLQFLIGQSMKEMKGSGNPRVLREILESLLDK